MIPIATTLITVLRLPADALVGGEYRDPYDTQPARDVVASGVRAHISSPGGSEQVQGGSQEVIQYRLDADPVDVVNTDQVLDENTAVTYEVVWVADRRGLGLNHIEAGLKTVGGVV